MSASTSSSTAAPITHDSPLPQTPQKQESSRATNTLHHRQQVQPPKVAGVVEKAKKGLFGLTWQSRYLTLTAILGDLLEWYLADGAPSPQRSLAIASTTKVTYDGKVLKVEFPTIGKTWLFRTQTQNGMLMWARALSLAGATVFPENLRASEIEQQQYQDILQVFLNEVTSDVDSTNAPLPTTPVAAAVANDADGVVIHTEHPTMRRTLTTLLRPVKSNRQPQEQQHQQQPQQPQQYQPQTAQQVQQQIQQHRASIPLVPEGEEPPPPPS